MKRIPDYPILWVGIWIIIHVYWFTTCAQLPTPIRKNISLYFSAREDNKTNYTFLILIIVLSKSLSDLNVQCSDVCEKNVFAKFMSKLCKRIGVQFCYYNTVDSKLGIYKHKTYYNIVQVV